MRKNRIIFIVFTGIFFLLNFFFFKISYVFAQSESFLKTTSAIEQENNSLKQEIRAFEKNIAVLDQQKKQLEKDFVKINTALETQKKQNDLFIQERLAQDSSSREKQERFRLEGIQIAKEIIQLEKEAQRQKQEEFLLRNQINILRQEIDGLKKQTNLLENPNWELEKKALKNSLTANKKKVKSLEVELARLQKKYQKPLGILEELKRDQFLLEQKMVVSQSALDNAVAEKQQQQVVLSQLDRQNQLQVLKLTEDITRLKVEKKRIESVLFKAKEKINTSHAAILSKEEWEKEIARLNKVLSDLDDEKKKLEEEKKILQESLN